MAQLIDGKAVAAKVQSEVAADVVALRARGVTPCLAVVLVGDDPASAVYVRYKEKACAATGIRSIMHTLPASATTADVLDVVDRLNADPSVHGILVQMPLPIACDAGAVLDRVSPLKDVDGFHTDNLGRLAAGHPRFVACTPAGVLRLLRESDTPIRGAHIVVVGRSRIVGLPMELLLLNESATVTVCHTETRDLPDIIRRADVVIVAIGDPRFVRGDWIRPGATVIDVGINRLADGTLVGDVEFESAARVARAITPVPGGVGPMTVAMLIHNTVQSAQRSA